MSKRPRRDEFLSERVVEAALGQPVTHLDDGLLPGQVDAEITLAGGRVGALEVTQMGDPKHFELIQTLARESWRWDSPGSWLWSLNVGRLRELKRLRAVVPRIVLACEANGVTLPSELPPRLLQLDPDARWIAWEAESRLQGLPQSGASPRIMLSPRGFGAVLPDSWAGLGEVVSNLLSTDNALSHIAKLRKRTDAAERHLFLIVTDRAVPPGWFFKLQRPDSVPDVPLTLPEGLDALWMSISAEWCLCFHRAAGWSVFETPTDVLRDVAA